jgi:hypothetical protein
MVGEPAVLSSADREAYWLQHPTDPAFKLVDN